MAAIAGIGGIGGIAFAVGENSPLLLRVNFTAAVGFTDRVFPGSCAL